MSIIAFQSPQTATRWVTTSTITTYWLHTL